MLLRRKCFMRMLSNMGTRAVAGRLLYVLAVCIFAFPLCSMAGVILGEMDWDSGAEGWSSSYTTLDDGVSQDWLAITFPTTVEPESGQDEWSDVIYVQAEDLFAGTWTTDSFIEFDFWAEDETPGALQVQWSSDTNSEVWAMVITPPSSTQEWTTYELSLSDWEDWMYPGSTEDQYLSDLSTVDWIGIYIYRDGPDEQTYGLDNFKLTIPEPAEIFMLASAFIASAMSMRKKKKRLEKG